MNKTKDFEFSITLNACAPFIKFGKMFPLVAPETGSREKEMRSASRKSVPKPRRLESQSESKFLPGDWPKKICYRFNTISIVYKNLRYSFTGIELSNM